MDPSAQLQAGTALADRYVLEARIGTGGAGVVWRAHDEVLGRRVAVKLLHASLAEDATSAARFRTEATAAARLTHPNAVVVYDIGEDRDHDYLVMELVDGPDLTEVLRDQPLPPSAAAYLGRAVAAALGAAHARGLVHRDVKPGNVLLTREGVPKVADFGIARAVGDAMARLTLPGNVMGTARYVSPEQLRDEPVDARADVYALGLVLHEAMTGAAPWGEGTATEVAARRLHGELPAVGAFRDDVPPGLDAVITRATRPERDERYADGAELAAALAPFCGDDALATLAGLARSVGPRTPGSDGSGHAGATRGVERSDDGAPSATPRAAERPSDPPRPAGPPAEPPPTAPGTAPPAAGAPTSHAARPSDATTSSYAATRPTAPPAPTGDTRALGAASPPPPAPPRRGRRRLTWLLGGLAVAIAGLVGFLGIRDASLPFTARPLSDVEVTAAGDHDPLGGGEERPELIGEATDGDTGTWWQTEGYERADLIPPDKDGVGIWFELSEERDVAEIDLELVTPGASFEIWAGDSVPDGDVRPSDWGERVASVSDAGDSERVRFDATSGSVWLVWFTHLPPDDDGRFRARVADVQVRGR